MSDCLVTNLKGVVNDSALYKLGVADIKFSISSGTQRGLRLNLAKATRVVTDKSCTILDTNGVQEFSSGTDFNLGLGNHYVKPDNVNQDVVVSVYNKYESLYQIGSNAGAYDAGIELLGSCSYMTALTAYTGVNGDVVDINLFEQSPLSSLWVTYAKKITGDLSSLYGKSFSNNIYILTPLANPEDNKVRGNITGLLSNAGSLVRFGVNSPDVTGDIAELAGYPLTALNIASSSISGAIEDFLEGWYSSGATSCTLYVPPTITLNGNALSAGVVWNGSVSITGGVLSLKDYANTIATYDGNSWTYL